MEGRAWLEEIGHGGQVLEGYVLSWPHPVSLCFLASMSGTAVLCHPFCHTTSPQSQNMEQPNIESNL
jgi:hypothetical protein